ncbi:MAG: substrate-binding domain-containing protein [Myxococcales bacterium]|nr:substrate-binding domain-containing protein [Myxococcales bacterium]
MMNARTGLMVLSFALSIAIGLVLGHGKEPSAAGSASSGDAPVLIGLSMDTLKEARWQRDRDMMLARARSQGAEVLVQSANSDDARQVADVEGLLTRHVNVLVVIPHDGTAMAKAVRLAHEAGVPVIAYDRIIRDSDLDLYVSFDNERVGQLQAQYVVDHLPKPGHGTIVRIYGSKADNNAHLFKKGQDEVLQPYTERGDIKVVHEDWADDWKNENAKRIVNAAISQHGPAFDAVLASNDGTAGGAIQALSEEGLAGKVLVTGQDAELVACQRIVAGTQAMTVYKPLERLADSAMDLAVSLARRRIVVAQQSVHNGKVDVPAVLSDVVVATKENMMDTVIKDGFLTRQDVYGSAP